MTGLLSGLVEACTGVQMACFCHKVFNNEELTSTRTVAPGGGQPRRLRRPCFQQQATIPSSQEPREWVQLAAVSGGSSTRLGSKVTMQETALGAQLVLVFPLVPRASVLGIGWSSGHHCLVRSRLNPGTIQDRIQKVWWKEAPPPHLCPQGRETLGVGRGGGGGEGVLISWETERQKLHCIRHALS